MKSFRHVSAVALLLVELAAAGPAAAQNPPEPIVQRWGIDDALGPVPHGGIAYHPESNRLLSSQGGGAVLWDCSSGLVLRSFDVDGLEFPHVTTLGFSRDGSRLLIGGKNTLLLRDAHSGDRLVQFDTQERSVRDADLSPDGRWAAAACDDAAVRIWDAHNGDLQRVLREHRYAITHVRFSPDSTQLLSGGNDRLGVLWDVHSGAVIHRLASPTEVSGTAFSSDGTRLLTYGSGEFWHTVRAVVWDRDSGLPLQTIARPLYSAWFVDRDVMLLQPSGELLRWPADRHELAPEPSNFPESTQPPNARMQVSKDHWTLRTEGDEPAAALLSPSGKRVPLPLPRRGAEHQIPLDFSADHRWLLTGGGYRAGDSNCVVWDLRKGRLHRQVTPGDSARFHPDSTRIAIASHRTITLYALESGEVLQTLQVDKGAIESLQFDAGGARILTASGDWYDGDQGQLLLWDAETGRRLRSYAPTEKAVVHAEMTPDEQTIVASFTPGYAGAAGVDQISLFDVASGEPVGNLSLPSYHYGGTILDPHGQFILSEHSQRELLAWDLETLQQRHRFPPRLGALSPDGQVVATYEDRGQLNFWSTDSGEFLASQAIPLGRPRASLFHPGGRLYVGNTTQTGKAESLLGDSIGFWDLQSGHLEAELFTFDDGREWLIRTAAGQLSGSEQGLRRVAWRHPATGSVTLDPPLTAARARPQHVAEALSRSLPDDVRLIDSLAELPRVPPGESDAPDVARYDPSEVSRRMMAETIRAFEEAGGDVKANIHGYVNSLHMEKRPITTELVERLAWIRSTERLYLAATGITDEQLEWVGMMGNVRRMSLWGNPITDTGLADLATMWDLEVLDVHGTAVTAEGLNQLWLLENLQTLIVPNEVDPDHLGPLQRLRRVEIIRREDAPQSIP